MANDLVWSVSLLNRKLQQNFADLGPLTLEGEFGAVRFAGSGHCYTTLKDGEDLIEVVFWRSTVARMSSKPTEGERAQVRGTLSLYGPRGRYNLVGTRVNPIGTGSLAQEFEKLKAKLTQEGLFSEEHKKELPWLPRGVGIATAEGSAAQADIMHSLAERFPSMLILQAHCQVQGNGAAASIVEALQSLDADDDCDVIIVGRGGGSIEDLWAFNEEPVVRAIAACKKPVISAVGHETDTCLSDLVADVRAKTPTYAGELVVPVEAEIRDELISLHQSLNALITNRLKAAQIKLQAYASHRALEHPRKLAQERRMHLQELRAELQQRIHELLAAQQQKFSRLQASLHPRLLVRNIEQAKATHKNLNATLQQKSEKRLEKNNQRLLQVITALEARSPLATLKRGYSVTTSTNGRSLHSVADAVPGDTITTKLIDGHVESVVRTMHRNKTKNQG